MRRGRHIAGLFALCCTIAACSAPPNPLTAVQKRALDNAIWASRTATVIDGTAYSVGVSPDRTFALVAPSTGTIWVVSEMVAAVQKVTGCRAKPDLVIASIAGGDLDVPINIAKVEGNITRMTSELSC